MWTAALSALPARPSPFPPDVRMSERQIDAVVAAVDDAVQDAELTVEELTDAIVARTGSWAGDRVMEAFQDKWPRWRQAESLAMNRGVLCFGPDRGRRVTYTNPHRWLPGLRRMDGEAALRTLVTRYLYAYGPASSVNEPAKDWYARVKSRPGFRPLLADRVSGVTPPTHYADLDF